MQTIILDDFGLFLGKKSNRFVVKKSGQTVAEFPAMEVERVLIASSGVSMSSAALYLAVENRIPVTFTYATGNPFAFLTPTIGHGTVLTRRLQYTEAESSKAVDLCRSFVAGKLLNQRNLLKTWAKNRTRTQPPISEFLFSRADYIDVIMSELDGINGQMTADLRQSLMNKEGRAASAYWEGVSQILPSELRFMGRTTRGATDPFNMMLNYGYGILYSEVWSAVNTAGLDPFAGFLHVDRPGRPSLVLDLIEEFRQQVVDRTLVALMTQRNAPISDIVEDLALSKSIRELIAKSIVERLEQSVTIGSSKIPLKNVIVRQAWSITKALRGDSEYQPFSLRW